MARFGCNGLNAAADWLPDMTSKRSRPVAVLVMLFPAWACYSPHDPVFTGDATTGEDESGSTSISPTSSVEDSSTTGGITSAATEESGPTEGTEASTGAVCGDAIVEGGEVCDDGLNDGSYGGCLSDCTAFGPHCGDGIEQGDEVCDDGDQTNGDGCNIDCVVSGTVLWTRIADGPAHAADTGYAVAIDDEDAIYAVGRVDGSDAWIRRYDATGSEDWTQTFAGPSNGESTPSVAAWGGAPELHVVGTHDAAILGNNDDAWLRRYTADGMLDGSFTWDNLANTADNAAGIAVNGEGQQFVLGDSNRYDLDQSWNIWLRKLDADGSEMWTQTYDGGESDTAGGLAIDAEGNVIAVGSTTVPNEGRNVWVRKYSPEGSTLWTKSYNSPGDCPDDGNDVAVDADDNVVVAGLSCGEIFVRKYSSDGSVEWTETFSDPDTLTNMGAGVATDSQGAVVVAGSEWVNYHQEAWLRKYASNGQELWTYVNSPDDASVFSSAEAIAIDSTDAIVVVGEIQADVPDGEPSDIWVQKFAP
jgi:cysteine-rich repeat protein